MVSASLSCFLYRVYRVKFLNHGSSHLCTPCRASQSEDLAVLEAEKFRVSCEWTDGSIKTKHFIL